MILLLFVRFLPCTVFVTKERFSAQSQPYMIHTYEHTQPYTIFAHWGHPPVPHKTIPLSLPPSDTVNQSINHTIILQLRLSTSQALSSTPYSLISSFSFAFYSIESSIYLYDKITVDWDIMIKRSNYFLVYAVSLLICQASGIRLPLSPTFSRGRRMQDDSTLKSMQVHERYVERSNVSSYLKIRGGGARSVISNFNEYIGESKSRSWSVLMISILIDSASAALMKTAQRDSSIKKLIVSFLGFLLRYVQYANYTILSVSDKLFIDWNKIQIINFAFVS